MSKITRSKKAPGATPKPGEQIGVQSVETAGHILKTLAGLDGPQNLSALSEAAGLAPAKAHRYLVSLIRAGLIEQNDADGRYDFGGAARLIGRVALNRLDLVRIGSQILSKLRDDLRETVFMGVWTPQGPMVLQWLDVVRPVSLVIRPGSIMPLYTSAFGLICAAFLPPDVVANAPELRESAGAARVAPRSAAELGEIREQGFSTVRGELIQGLDALAVPVLDSRNDLVACLAAVGASGSLETAPDGAVVAGLKRAARQFENALG